MAIAGVKGKRDSSIIKFHFKVVVKLKFMMILLHAQPHHSVSEAITISGVCGPRRTRNSRQEQNDNDRALKGIVIKELEQHHN